MQKSINLNHLFNHKFIYHQEELEHTELGLDNTYILKSEISNNSLVGLNNVLFSLSNNYYDNIVCDSQELLINDYIDKLHILGFAYWGSTNTFFEIVFEDDTKLQVKIPFIDWVSKITINYQSRSWYGENIKTIKQIKSEGMLNHTVNFHHSITNIDSKKLVKKIIFPDNFLVHVFSITIEKPDSNRWERLK